jgi:hypothetical protein
MTLHLTMHLLTLNVQAPDIPSPVMTTLPGPPASAQFKYPTHLCLVDGHKANEHWGTWGCHKWRWVTTVYQSSLKYRLKVYIFKYIYITLEGCVKPVMYAPCACVTVAFTLVNAFQCWMFKVESMQGRLACYDVNSCRRILGLCARLDKWLEVGDTRRVGLDEERACRVSLVVSKSVEDSWCAWVGRIRRVNVRCCGKAWGWAGLEEHGRGDRVGAIWWREAVRGPRDNKREHITQTSTCEHKTRWWIGARSVNYLVHENSTWLMMHRWWWSQIRSRCGCATWIYLPCCGTNTTAFQTCFATDLKFITRPSYCTSSY